MLATALFSRTVQSIKDRIEVKKKPSLLYIEKDVRGQTFLLRLQAAASNLPLHEGNPFSGRIARITAAAPDHAQLPV